MQNQNDDGERVECIKHLNPPVALYFFVVALFMMVRRVVMLSHDRMPTLPPVFFRPVAHIIFKNPWRYRNYARSVRISGGRGV
jgi:hypothetical protein